MGLTIHFKGQLRDIKQLPAFVEEVEDIANSLNWKSHRIDEVVELEESCPLAEERTNGGVRIRGLHVTPPKCETFCFTFAPSGKMMSLFGVLSAARHPEEDFAYWLHTKTQYAGIELHIAAISLMRYLEKKYFQYLEVSDEGQYWESNDVDLLTQRFDEYTKLIAAVRGALEKASISPNLSKSNLIDKITEIIQKGLKDLDN
ncbi:MAG: hypothetical protein AAGG68_30505 [Bacteroidota bacterium]